MGSSDLISGVERGIGMSNPDVVMNSSLHVVMGVDDINENLKC